MKNVKTFTQFFAILSLFGALATPTVSATQIKTNSNSLLATQLTLNAQYSASAALEENLNQVVDTINASVKKELAMSVRNNQSLVVALAKGQSVKDDKVTSSVSE